MSLGKPLGRPAKLLPLTGQDATHDLVQVIEIRIAEPAFRRLVSLALAAIGGLLLLG